MNKYILSIGGIGGSGTRVVAQIIKDAGYFIGNDLNNSNDNLLFTLLFKRTNILTLSDLEFIKLWNIFFKLMATDIELSNDEIIHIKKLASNGRTLHSEEWLCERLKFLYKNKNKELWGWKEPNTHIIIERLLKLQKNLKFIYVYRNGLDMAYSSNQNQLRLWGDIFFNKKETKIIPKNSLKYWCIIHRRMLELEKTYKDKILLLNFDNLCVKPIENLTILFKFINMELDSYDNFVSKIKKPLTMGRYKKYNLKNFDQNDIDFIKLIFGIKI